ncbi:MAG TPA: hypothetical protein PKJ95_00575 [Atribacterota bacterium]|nr:hypothetical protein [Atribacterota bacterium]
MIGNTWSILHSQLKQKKTKPILTDRDYRMVSTPSSFLELGHYDGRRISLFDFQRAYIDDINTFVAVAKSRQLGHSEYGIAGCAMAKSHLYKPLTSILVSYNLKECKEKIQKALLFWEGIHPSLRSPIDHDNAFEIWLKNGSRLISVFSPRGFSRSDIYLDEMSFYENQTKTYTDSTAVIAWGKGKRQLRIGGTPFGKGGLYYDIINKTDGKYLDFSTHIWFWWDCPLYCHNIPLAREQAHLMSTHDRVMKFGTPVIQQFYRNMFLEDFQQEFEICFNDTELSYFPYDLIVQSMSHFSFEDQMKFPETIEQIAPNIQGVLFGGYDIGRTTDNSEFYVLDMRTIDKKAKRKTILRELYHESIADMGLSDQKAKLCRFIDMYHSNIGCIYIDKTGIGFNIAEDLAILYPDKVKGIYFTHESKTQMISTAKGFMTDDTLELMPDRDLIAHFYSIKRHVTSAGNMVFVAEKNGKHHADKCIGVSLACLAARSAIDIAPGIFVFGGEWDFSPEIDMFTNFN